MTKRRAWKKSDVSCFSLDAGESIEALEAISVSIDFMIRTQLQASEACPELRCLLKAQADVMWAIVELLGGTD